MLSFKGGVETRKTLRGQAVAYSRALLQLNGDSVAMSYYEPIKVPVLSAKRQYNSASHRRPKQAAQELNMYPNPAQDYTVLQWDGMKMGLSQKELSIALYDRKGQLVGQSTIANGWNNTHTLRTAHLPAGTYQVQLSQGEGFRYIASLTVIKP